MIHHLSLTVCIGVAFQGQNNYTKTSPYCHEIPHAPEDISVAGAVGAQRSGVHHGSRMFISIRDPADLAESIYPEVLGPKESFRESVHSGLWKFQMVREQCLAIHRNETRSEKQLQHCRFWPLPCPTLHGFVSTFASMHELKLAEARIA